MNSTPVVGGRLSRITNPSTEMTPHRNLAHPTIESDPVGPHSIQEQSVSLRFDADHGEHYPDHRVHPGVRMFRAQPVADGPAGPDRKRRPVGPDEVYATQDDVRPTAGGPVGRHPVSCPLEYRKISSSDDSYQPLFTGPLGTNEMIAVNDQSRPAVSGPLGRQYSLDPMGPRATLSLGDRNQPPSVGPVGRPELFERPVDRVTESDFKLTTQTRSESGSETVVTDSVIRTESDAQTVWASVSMANGPTDLNAISSSSDAVRANISIANGPMLTTQTRSESGSETVVTDSVIRTESDAQTVRANISMANGPTDLNAISSSSDAVRANISIANGPMLTSQTRSESGSETVVTDSVIRTESDAQTVRANIGMANGPTDLNAISSSSDAVRANISIANGPMLTTQTRSESGSETVVTDSVIRTESDAQTVRANIGMANGPTDLNAISSSSDAVRVNISIANGPMLTTQTRSESGSETVVTDSVIRTESDAQTVRANISIANGPTDSNAISSSSDAVVHKLGGRLIQTEIVSESVAGRPVPVIQTKCEVQIDRSNGGIANGPTDPSVSPPSSDSGVHSLGEQWENMSTNSLNTGSIQTVNTFNDSVVYQEDSKNQESHKLVFCSGTVCGEKDSMAYSTTDSQNSDIAAMSDFSDDEDESQGELRPKIRTECVSEDSIKEGSINGERSDPNTTTVGVGSKTLDPDDKEYWTKFRLLTRQAFLLDNVKLSESDYPDAVKEVVTRSRLTIIELNKGEDIPLEQYSEGEMSDDSDADSSINRYKSEYDHNLEDYRDWHYNRAPVVPIETADDVSGTIRNVDYNDGQCRTGREGIEVGTDEHSEPGGRARSELTPEKTGRLIDTLDVNSVINDDITVIIRDSTGVSHRQDDEIRMVSMITVDVSQGQTKSQDSISREIRDHVTPVGGEKQDSVAHGDVRLGGKYSIRNVTVVCSDGCDFTRFEPC